MRVEKDIKDRFCCFVLFDVAVKQLMLAGRLQYKEMFKQNRVCITFEEKHSEDLFSAEQSFSVAT